MARCSERSQPLLEQAVINRTVFHLDLESHGPHVRQTDRAGQPGDCHDRLDRNERACKWACFGANWVFEGAWTVMCGGNRAMMRSISVNIRCMGRITDCFGG